MWAQLITARLKPGSDLSTAADVLKSLERPGSGLVREIFMQNQNDPTMGYVLAVFESEDKAREREHAPESVEVHQAMNDLLGKILAGPPEFLDMTVTAEWAP